MTEFLIPQAVTFEQAIELSQSLLNQMEQSQLSESELAAAVSQLVSSENGARGFFVTYLTDDRPLADEPASGVLQALQTAPERVGTLLVKNLAMSTAMILTHEGAGDPQMATGSQQVQTRCVNLIRKLQLEAVQVEARRLWESTRTGEGDYQAFLERWGYDSNQRLAIAEALQPLIESGSLQQN
jgi:hypothetical protein